MNIVATIIDDITQDDPPKKRPLLHIQKDYIYLRKDLWIRHGGSLPIPNSSDYQIVEDNKMIKIIPHLSQVMAHMLKPEFFIYEVESKGSSGSYNVHTSNSSPLTQARTQMAKNIFSRLRPCCSFSTHVEPVLNAQRRVHTSTLAEVLQSLEPSEEARYDTFGQIVKDLPEAELIFKLMSSSLKKSVIFQGGYTTKLTFILYNAARIKQILESYVESFGPFPSIEDIQFDALNEEGILAISYLSKYPLLLRELRTEGSIHNLPHFLTDFVGEFSRYYRSTRILRESPHLKKCMDAKIHFLRFVLYFLHHSLSILNISCLSPWIKELCPDYLPST